MMVHNGCSCGQQTTSNSSHLFISKASWLKLVLHSQHPETWFFSCFLPRQTWDIFFWDLLPVFLRFGSSRLDCPKSLGMSIHGGRLDWRFFKHDCEHGHSQYLHGYGQPPLTWRLVARMWLPLQLIMWFASKIRLGGGACPSLKTQQPRAKCLRPSKTPVVR